MVLEFTDPLPPEARAIVTGYLGEPSISDARFLIYTRRDMEALVKLPPGGQLGTISFTHELMQHLAEATGQPFSLMMPGPGHHVTLDDGRVFRMDTDRGWSAINVH